VKAIGIAGAVGFLGFFLSKLLWMLMLPVVGMFIGFLIMVFKIALIVGLVWLGFSLFRKWTDRPSQA
jgi:hypothetical protein